MQRNDDDDGWFSGVPLGAHYLSGADSAQKSP